MNGQKAIGEIEQPYSPNGERSGKQDRRRQDKTDSSSDIPDGRQLDESCMIYRHIVQTLVGIVHGLE